MFLRAAEAFGDVWNRLRKFTRMQNATGDWYLFRFWEAAIYPDLATREETCAIVRGLLGNGACQMIITKPARGRCHVIDFAPTEEPVPRLMWTDRALAAINEIVIGAAQAEVTDASLDPTASAAERAHCLAVVQTIWRWLEENGITSLAAVRRLTKELVNTGLTVETVPEMAKEIIQNKSIGEGPKSRLALKALT